MIKIIVDTLGGDHSPKENIKGAISALNDNKDLYIILVGDKEVIAEELKNFTFNTSRIEIIHAPDEISCNDIPTDAIRNKTNSSLYQSIELLKKDESIGGLVSIGSTGALMAGAVLKIGRMSGIKRPCFCPVLPTMNKKIVGICDSGANVDCDSLQLQQFAIMGSLYLKTAYNVENPKIALLNVGVEEEKGDALRKEVYKILKNQTSSINFVGNMESRDLLKGNYDLVVCDGFAGNVLLKSTEGACLEMLKMLKSVFYKNLKTKLGAMLLKSDIMEIKDFMDYNNYGGAVLLGVKKTIVKGHGSSNAKAIQKCIEQAYNMEKNNLRSKISEEIANTQN